MRGTQGEPSKDPPFLRMPAAMIASHYRGLIVDRRSYNLHQKPARGGLGGGVVLFFRALFALFRGILTRPRQPFSGFVKALT